MYYNTYKFFLQIGLNMKMNQYCRRRAQNLKRPGGQSHHD